MQERQTPRRRLLLLLFPEEDEEEEVEDLLGEMDAEEELHWMDEEREATTSPKELSLMDEES